MLWITVLLGFVGAVMLLRPTITPSQLWPAFVGLGSGAVSAVAYWNVRQLVQADEPEERVVFYFALFSTAGALVWMLPQPWHAITLDNVGYLAGVGDLRHRRPARDDPRVRQRVGRSPRPRSPTAASCSPRSSESSSSATRFRWSHGSASR